MYSTLLLFHNREIIHSCFCSNIWIYPWADRFRNAKFIFGWAFPIIWFWSLCAIVAINSLPAKNVCCWKIAGSFWADGKQRLLISAVCFVYLRWHIYLLKKAWKNELNFDLNWFTWSYIMFLSPRIVSNFTSLSFNSDSSKAISAIIVMKNGSYCKTMKIFPLIASFSPTQLWAGLHRKQFRVSSSWPLSQHKTQVICCTDNSKHPDVIVCMRYELFDWFIVYLVKFDPN